MGRRYVTDQGLDAIPVLAGATPDERTLILADADQVWAHVRDREWTDATEENAVFEHFERQGVAAERVTNAVELLVATGRLAQLDADAQSLPPQLRLGSLTVDQLRDMAAERGVKGRSHMNRDELIQALA